MKLTGAQGNVNQFTTAAQNLLASGERIIGSEWRMTVDGFPELSALFRSTQLPEITRKKVEDHGNMGTHFWQWGPIVASGELSATAVETIQGPLLAALRKIIREKLYVNITVELTPESLNGKPPESGSFPLLNCLLSSEAVDLATEDTEALMSVSLLINYNGIDGLK